MFSRLNIFEIVKDGLKVIKGETKSLPFIIFYLAFPLFISCVVVYLNFGINNDIVSNIISSISLLSGLLFSVIFILIGNYLSRKKEFLSSEIQDEKQRYLGRYRQFTGDLTTLILFSIVVAIFTIVASFMFGIIDKNSIVEDGDSLILFTIHFPKGILFTIYKHQLNPLIKTTTISIYYLL